MTAARNEPDLDERLSAADLRDAWPLLSAEDRALSLREAPRSDAEDVFFGLTAHEQAEILRALPPDERRSWLRLLPPDDAADLIQESQPEERDSLLGLLDDPTRHEVQALLAYAEDRAGGLMNPRYARLRPDMTVDEAISYLRRQARETLEAVYYVYVLDEAQRLLGVVSFRELFAADGTRRVSDIMHRDLVTVSEDMDQEAVSRLFDRHKFIAIPVVDAAGHMKGIVTADDIVDVVREEATEDIQKIGGTAAFDEPYMKIGFWNLIRKRGGWLAALFLGEMLTASAMAYFQDELARAVVLTLFIPLIISSGGNSGSQASTLVIRAMSLGEVRLRDWWRVMRREVAAGLALGSVLGAIGFLRVETWQAAAHIYGAHHLLLAVTILGSLIGVVTFGTLAGSLLPFVLRRLGLDPATASAPFVATLVDVTGIVIYFTVASLILRGTLL
jgi:magnesium transporter